MISPVTCVCVLLAAGSGLYLYQEKHQAQMLDQQIEQVMRTADAAHARTGMLRAEYALLNDPSRLQELARAHLPTLANTDPKQFTSLVELDRRLPAVGEPPATAPAPLEPAAPLAKLPQPVVPVPILAPAPVIAAVRPQPAPHPTLMARAAIVTAPAAVLMASIQATPLARLAHASSRAAVVRMASARPAQAASRPAYVSYRPYGYGAPATSSEVVARIARGGPVDAGIPIVASALGMARSMVASGPVGQAYAASYYSGGAQAR